MHVENMTIHISGEVPAALARLLAEATTAASDLKEPATLPRIGEAWPGVDGVYAGIARGENGEADHHLVLLHAKPSSTLAWEPAKAWASSIGGELPTRFESALLYANVRDQFDTSSWHWTGTQSSGGGAWGQYFGDGYQLDNGKKFEAAARAVIRFPL